MAILSTLKRRTLGLFTIVGAIVMGLVLLGLTASAIRCASGEKVPSQAVLELDLRQQLVESMPSDPVLGWLASRQVGSVRGVVETLERAGDDDRVSGVVAYLGATSHGMAVTQELRDAVTRFREKGKFAVAFADTFGEFSPGNQGYYLATAFDEVWLQPSGDIGLTGLISESNFVRGTLELLDVKYQGDHRKEYKNALNMFTERRFTPAHREATQAVMDDMFNQILRGIAERRGLEVDDVAALVDRGPFIASEALEAKLVDQLGYRDEAIAHVKELAGEGATLLYAHKYRKRTGPLHDDGDKVALIYGVGAVVRGSSGVDPVFGQQTMGSETVAAALRAAIDDEDVKAIVFRVNSPGGSYVASDSIWRETVRAREAGKPVIVTMGNVAGSGGYFVAMNATKIVAQPGTITGSIGVLGGKVVTRQLWNKFGVTWDEVHTSKNSTMWSSMHEYNGDGWKRFQAWLDRVYADFTQKVADGRGLTVEGVDEIAKGRIWSGERARQLGLVDELGGYATAIGLAKEAAGIESDAGIELVELPRRKSWYERFAGEGAESSERSPQAAEVVTTLDRWLPVAEQLREIGFGPGSNGVLATPPLTVGP